MIIGLCSKKRSGKTTSFKMLEDMFASKGVEVKEIMFAGPLKSFICESYDYITMDMVEDQSIKELDLFSFVFTEELLLGVEAYWDVKVSRECLDVEKTSIRGFLQYLGTDVLRSVDDKIHIRAAHKQVDPSKINIITDVRFMNEYEYLSKLDGFVSIALKRDLGELCDTHLSEQGVEDVQAMCSVVIENNGTLEDLRQSLEAAVIGKNLAA